VVWFSWTKTTTCPTAPVTGPGSPRNPPNRKETAREHWVDARGRPGAGGEHRGTACPHQPARHGLRRHPRTPRGLLAPYPVRRSVRKLSPSGSTGRYRYRQSGVHIRPGPAGQSTCRCPTCRCSRPSACDENRRDHLHLITGTALPGPQPVITTNRTWSGRTSASGSMAVRPNVRYSA
jgi:hypothetical protein